MNNPEEAISLIKKSHEKRKKELPSRYIEPELDALQSFFLDHFMRLSISRVVQEGSLNFILYTEMDAYFSLQELSYFLPRREFVNFISEVDCFYVEKCQLKLKKTTP